MQIISPDAAEQVQREPLPSFSIPDFVDADPVTVEAHVNPNTRQRFHVQLAATAGNFRFSHSMRPEQALVMADALTRCARALLQLQEQGA